MKKAMISRVSGVALAAAVASAMSMPASAYNLYKTDGAELNFDLEAMVGYFSSDETYGNAKSSPSWTEGYAKYGFSGNRTLGKGQLFGAVNALSSGTWGDGDAAGFTTGHERKTDIEDLYLGYRTDSIEFSAGRQNLTLGNGFILNGDALNLGKGLDGVAPVSMDRGGAYWLAGRKAFDKTAVLRVGGDKGARADLFWFHSDNPAQSEVEMAGVNAEYVTDKGTFGLLYLKGLGVNNTEAAFLGQQGRDGQRTASIRYEGNAGVKNLFLSAQYVDQAQGNSNADANAWYAEAGWTFANLPWSPSVNYRYTSYDKGYDPLFFGFNRGYGTWFQGEVAANYAGPFGTDADINYLGVTAAPTEALTVGGNYFNFSNTKGGTGSNDANEIDLWAQWAANDHLIISPLVGLYTPDSASSTQGNDNTNTYFQVLAIVPF